MCRVSGTEASKYHGHVHENKAGFRDGILKGANKLQVWKSQWCLGRGLLVVVEGIALRILHKGLCTNLFRDGCQRNLTHNIFRRRGKKEGKEGTGKLFWQNLSAQAIGARLAHVQVAGLEQVGRRGKGVVTEQRSQQGLVLDVASVDERQFSKDSVAEFALSEQSGGAVYECDNVMRDGSI